MCGADPTVAAGRDAPAGSGQVRVDRAEEVHATAESAQAASASGPGTEPRSAAVSFITTEHFTLQGARASTVAESTGRATMFLGAVSAGLVALGLMATATQVGRAFYASVSSCCLLFPLLGW
jgi:hypothetical protein